MDKKEFLALLHKYKEGKASMEEVLLVEKWYQQYGDGFPDISAEEEKELRDSMYQQIFNNLDKVSEAKPIKELPLLIRKMSSLRSLGQIAAICIGIVSLVYFVWEWKTRNEQIQTEQPMEEIVEATTGQIKSIVLPDSSRLWLNGGTKIKFKKPFNVGKDRRVELICGEVYFEVKRNPEKPFMIQSEHLLTRVLGTSFSVKSYPELAYEQVNVSSGKVQVSTSDGKTKQVLLPGDQIRVDKQDHTFLLNQIDISTTNGWKDGVTYLDQASFVELSSAVKNIYGLELIADRATIVRQKYTLSIDRSVPVKELMEVISSMNNNQYRKEGNKLVIY